MCGGTSSTSAALCVTLTVYPRVCGGTSDQWAALCVIDGLSPRVRGNPCDRRLPRPRRSIPACAGERGRAENELTAGSIPACAGEPLYRNPDLVRSRVYPRVCGGTSRECGFGGGVGGLSPRVRGNLQRRNRPDHPARSIPACAGEPTISAVTLSVNYPPRVRGNRHQPVVPWETGLSPRVRGNPFGIGARGECLSPRVRHGSPLAMRPITGSIPACAGEPAIVLTETLTELNANRSIPACAGEPIPVFDNGIAEKVACAGEPRSLSRSKIVRSIPACAGEPLSVLYLFPPLLWSYRLIVLHQVDPVSIDYLLRLLSQYLNSLAAYRRWLPPGHYYRSLLHLGIPPSQYFPNPPPYATCHVWRRVYAGRYLQHGRGKKTSITRRDIDRNYDCHLLPPSSRRARRLASLR